MIKTELAHSFNDELDVIVDGGMLIRRDIVEADAMATIVPRLGRRGPAGSSEVRQIFPATLYAGQAGLCGLGQRAGEGDARIRMGPAATVSIHDNGQPLRFGDGAADRGNAGS